MQDPSKRPLIGRLWNRIQAWLIPILEDELGALDPPSPGRLRRGT